MNGVGEIVLFVKLLNIAIVYQAAKALKIKQLTSIRYNAMRTSTMHRFYSTFD